MPQMVCGPVLHSTLQRSLLAHDKSSPKDWEFVGEAYWRDTSGCCTLWQLTKTYIH